VTVHWNPRPGSAAFCGRGAQVTTDALKVTCRHCQKLAASWLAVPARSSAPAPAPTPAPPSLPGKRVRSRCRPPAGTPLFVRLLPDPRPFDADRDRRDEMLEWPARWW
jgi:hypothetical protein